MEETGWKLVHGDVFRPPQYSSILCAFIGSGVQIGLMAMITIVVAMFGMLSPSARGSLVTGTLNCVEGIHRLSYSYIQIKVEFSGMSDVQPKYLIDGDAT